MTRRTALVTGANGGIGSAVCDRLRAAGVAVRTMDVAGPADVIVDLSADEIPAEATGDVDICVSVAGVVGTFAPAHSMSAKKWSRDIDVNLTGSFRVIQACLPGMRERRFGRIVAISSMAGQLGSPGKVAYAASKAGLHGMIRTIAIENCSLGITANCVLPGMIATPPVLALPEADQERIRAAVPSGRFGRPDEVADLVAFLARDASGYITAQEIGIDGGLQLNSLYVGPTRTGRADG
ncbi:SDR family oxidoreductase [Mycobacterium triplex]|uniref:3-oxoacyl-[acyl-carrier-protein] reductase MabA n=1 Tax=Mycobacterium triplex TaxID=47839 RepID=A0A024JZ15_9MYCO|nr:SDR family NAD(P)-dependent oxidoreductase [Mycobacterium triplex]CDO88784.1 short-chain dehydrogenase/reductase SDR [Mycobacterium triplex]